MYLLSIYLPLMGAILAGFFGRFLGKKGAAFITTFLVGCAALVSFYIFYEVALCQAVCHIKLIPWIESGVLVNYWGFLFDSLTATMLIVVTLISFLVHLYSIEYMGEDPHIPRFMAFLSLFTFCMLMLVTADNFIQMFLGWEGVGLASYLLINFWYTRSQANKSAMKAMIVNRIGDFGIIIGILIIFFVFKSVDYSVVFATAYLFENETINFLGYSVSTITLIGLFLFLGAVGKSAQIGLHTWLPDAMEGPTPVSALIHAATMVTAGVFLLLRCSPILEYSETVLLVIVIFGALTAFFAATSGLLQNDLKKVIAYSTCSQLGYMIFICGLSNYSVSIFHLMNHAYFKALLFLSAGSVIHALMDEQDMRKMGGLLHILPFTYVMIIIGSLALMGFPYLTGYYSKDVILELAYVTYNVKGTFAYWLGTISAFFTAFYSFRLLYLTFLAPTNSYKSVIKNAHDAPLLMSIPLVVLAFGSIFVGYLFKDMFIGLGTPFWNNALFTQPSHVTMIEAEFLPTYIKIIPVIFSMFGAILALFLNVYAKRFIYLMLTEGNKVFKELYFFLNNKWYFDTLYTKYIVNSILYFGYHISFKFLDRGLIELIGPLGIVRTFNSLLPRVSKLQSGSISHYIFLMVVGLTLILAYLNLDFVLFNEYGRILIIFFLVVIFSTESNVNKS